MLPRHPDAGRAVPEGDVVTARKYLTELAIVVASVILPAAIMTILPFLLVAWIWVGSHVFWALVDRLPETITVLFWLWFGYYIATCLVFYATFRYLLRRFGI